MSYKVMYEVYKEFITEGLADRGYKTSQPCKYISPGKRTTPSYLLHVFIVRISSYCAVIYGSGSLFRLLCDGVTNQMSIWHTLQGYS